MSSTPHQADEGQTQFTEPSVAQPLADWRAGLDRFGAAFDAEISEILSTLASLPPEDADETPRGAANSDQTMEFTLPATPPPPLPSAPPKQPQQQPAREIAAEPNRLAALKAKLSQQMASTGLPHPAALRPAEEARR
jgi:hypothetical protein